jgi:hypothetical protein
MTCAEFQKVLPDIIDAGPSGEEEAHLKSCPVCMDLVADLKYIAEQAKLLVPMIDPAPQVWDGIQTSLEREGLVRPAGTRRFPAPVAVPQRSWGVGAIVAIAALVLIALALFSYRNSHPPTTTAEVANPAPAIASDVDDEDTQLLQEVSQHSPRSRATYEENLKSVNRYIADAKRAVQENPNSEQAHDHLISASAQKAMLYRMAMSRSLQ